MCGGRRRWRAVRSVAGRLAMEGGNDWMKGKRD